MNTECKSVYQIRVQGRLHEHWSTWFNGLAVTSETTPDGTPITTMVCAVVDQSALHGILETILNLNLPLISVIRMEAEAQVAAAGAPHLDHQMSSEGQGVTLKPAAPSAAPAPTAVPAAAPAPAVNTDPSRGGDLPTEDQGIPTNSSLEAQQEG